MKVALVFVCINPMYWPFLKDIIEDSDKHFLKDHEVHKFVWSDMPELDTPEYDSVLLSHKPDAVIKGEMKAFEDQYKMNPTAPNVADLQDQFQQAAKQTSRETLETNIKFLRARPDLTIFPTTPVVWPMATLMRYSLFLQEEEKLKDYDYIFYCDVDMRMVDTIDLEIMGAGLTAALHPMYAFRPGLRFPVEPNKDSAAYIRIPQFYYAGGFQGGKSKDFIEAMKAMKKTIEYDLNRNYIAIWNDESHWNRYLLDHPPTTICSPSYIYPDSMIDNYYVPIWGVNYKPKIVTLTKKFNLSKEGAAAAQGMMNDLVKIKP